MQLTRTPPAEEKKAVVAPKTPPSDTGGDCASCRSLRHEICWEMSVKRSRPRIRADSKELPSPRPT